MVDILVLDEGQILTENAMADMVPATNAAPNGLVLLMGTPPRDKDPGEVFRQRRGEALGGDPDTLYVEFSADDDADLDDWVQLAKANPSFPGRTSKTAVKRMRKLLGSDDSFRREALGIWDPQVGGSRLISPDLWESTAVDEVAEEGVRCFSVAFSADGQRQAVAGALKHAGGVHVELVGAYSGVTDAGVAALADWLAERERVAKTALIVVSGRAGADALIEALRARNVPKRMIHMASTREYCSSCSIFFDAVKEGTVTHTRGVDDDALDASVAICDKKPRSRDGAWGWDATTLAGDETPLEAVSLAFWAARTTKRKPKGLRQGSGVRVF